MRFPPGCGRRQATSKMIEGSGAAACTAGQRIELEQFQDHEDLQDLQDFQDLRDLEDVQGMRIFKIIKIFRICTIFNILKILRIFKFLMILTIFKIFKIALPQGLSLSCSATHAQQFWKVARAEESRPHKLSPRQVHHKSQNLCHGTFGAS